MSRLKMITVYCSLITALCLVPSAYCLTYDFNGDSFVNLLDYEQFAGGWGTIYDANDLVAFGNEWLSYGGDCDGPPQAKNQTVRYGSGDPVTVNLVVIGEYTSISIESLPANGSLLSGSEKITSVPFALASAKVNFEPNGQSGGAFSFSATDNIAAPCGGETTATVQIVWSKPQAAAIDYAVEAKVGERLVFAGSDPDNSGNLRYVITDYSSSLNLIDPLGGPVYKKPWTMLRNMPHVVCGSNTTGSYQVKYKVSDETFVSDESTVSVTVTANSQDALFFDGKDDYISLPDNADRFDLISGRAIYFYLKTSQRDGCVLKKRGSGAGYELWIVRHVPQLRLYNSSGEKVYSINFSDTTYGLARLDNFWCHIGFCYKPKEATPATELWTGLAYTHKDGIGSGYMIHTHYGYDLPEFDYTNDQPLVCMHGVRGGFDALRFHASFDPIDPTGPVLVFTQNRQTAGTSTLMVPAAAVVFQFRGTNYFKDSTLAYTFTAIGSPVREPLDFYYFNSIFER